jgi:hypothetical protein
MSEHPANPEPPPIHASLIDSGMCPQCGYTLRGLPRSANCPECGKAYAPADVLPEIPLPSAFNLCIRFGWPLAVAGVLAGPGFMSNRGGEPLICTSLILFALTPVNSLVQRWLLTRKFSTEGNRRVILLRWWGVTAVIMFWTTFLLPFVVVGGCFIVVMISLQGGMH